MRLIEAACCGLLMSFSVSAQVEFHHWWTSKGEQAALQELERQLAAHKVVLDDAPVSGGGGDSALMVLQARALAGNPPHFAQLEGTSIKAWDAIGIVHNLNPVAGQFAWDETLTPLAVQFNKTDNGYIALPLTLHKMNWLWSNQKLLAELDLPVPQDWPQMIAAMRKARSAGITPLAVGKKPWQVAQLFEHVSIAFGGVEFYRKALVALDRKALASPVMRQIVARFRELSVLVDENMSHVTWDQATRNLAQDRALFQLGGDWILGELLALGIAVPGHITCTPTPQTENIFIYNIDSLIFLQRADFPRQAVLQLAHILADHEFQRRFNIKKGSLPVRSDTVLDDFNPCQQASARYLEQAVQNRNAVPSLIDSMAVNPVQQHAINNELYRFFTDRAVSDKELVTRMIAIANSR